MCAVYVVNAAVCRVKYVEAELARQKGKQQEESDKSQQQRSVIMIIA